MKRLVLVLVVTLGLIFSVGGGQSVAGTTLTGATSVDPALSALADPHELVAVVVALKSQADLSAARSARRGDRPGAVKQILRSHAARTQKGILQLLNRRVAQQVAADVVPLWIANEISLRATPAVIKELARRPEVGEIRPEFTVQAPPGTPSTPTSGAAIEPNIALVNASAMWNQGFRGQGVVVANMDTGVDSTHPDLASKWRGGTNSWYDPNGQHQTTPTDINGHGTQTMGVIVGGGAGGTAIGMAPDAKWIAVKIFNDSGAATSTGIHLGFQWLLDPDGNPATPDAPNVVNNSWTMSAAGCNLDFQPDLRSLRAAGILPVFAAGNGGPMQGSVFSPANNPEAFAVGGTDLADVIDPYSSRGPSACSGAVSPKLVAPGVNIRTSDVYGGYVNDTGTSVAAPHAAGALALLLSAFPGITADRQETALESGAASPRPPGPDSDYGYGRLDVLAAYQWLASSPDFSLTASPASVTTAPGGSASYAVSVGAVNGFAGDVVLSLTGLSATQASWSFTPAVVSGGTGTAQLSLTASGTITPGSYPLTITGSSGSNTRTTSVTLIVPAPPDFKVSALPASQTVVAGSTATYTASVSSLNGFTGDVTFSLSGLPGSVGSASFSPAVVTASGSSQLSITTARSAPAGAYSLTVTGTSGSIQHTSAVTLTVTTPDFSLSASPRSITISRGQTASYTITISSTAGFTASVSLSVSSVPAGASVTFAPNPVNAPGSSTFSVRTTSTSARGTFGVRVTGKAGTLVHQITVTLIVR